MESQIQPGTVVSLKSGGPRMTVETIDGEQAYCQWFVKHEVQHGQFPIHSLEVVVDGPPVRVTHLKTRRMW